jgi:hypothetical protein
MCAEEGTETPTPTTTIAPTTPASTTQTPTTTPPPITTSAPTTTPPPTTTSPPAEEITNENLRLAVADPKKYKGAKVDLMGQVSIESSKEGYYGFYFHPDKEDTFLSVIVYTKGEYTPKDDEFVRVTGTIEGEDWLGDLTIIADNIIKIDPKDFLTPTIMKLNVGKTLDHKGYIIVLEYIEFAGDETRVYLTIKNGRNEKITFYDFNAVAIQGNKQFEKKYSEWSYYIDHPEIPSEIRPGIEAFGVVIFEPLDIGKGEATFIFEGGTESWDVKIEDFEFEIQW